ncbi:MAG: phospho-sugar mutase [Tidjanibacter sp.]|nr:phospho-sugar mutase [Tidjanibacter sp.]
MEQDVLERANKWLEGDFDQATKKQVKYLIDNDPKELSESFYRDLEFGTGGLRGIMGVGTNRMNIYTVGMATQGLANYLKKCFAGEQIKVAISHDCRNLSREFAERTADIFASNGIKVYLFDSLRPTPELSFAIRHLGCKSGVMVTASHNPREYNGYKAYWEDGSQVVPPHDKNIIAEVGKITSVDQIVSGLHPENITIIGEEMDKIYLDKVHSLSLSPEAVKTFHDMKIVYTPIHGCGYRLVPASLAKYGFTNITVVPEQAVIDGNFPTVESPNPEERTTMRMAIELGRKLGAEIVMATDPDSDRIGIAVPDGKGDYVLLNGNQTCVLLTYYMCRRWKELGRINGHQYIVKTIVTSEMMGEVAKSFGVKYFDCLTGFKNIAKVIRAEEAKGETYIGGGEESFGFLAGSFLRDKDGVSACSLAAEAAAWAKSNGTNLYDLIKQLYVEYGYYREGLVSVVRKGQEGQKEIAQMMVDYRQNPPKSICGSQIVTIKDYQSSVALDTATGKTTAIDIDKSNVLQYLTADGTILSIRPSGTEPKIKYYFGVVEPLKKIADFEKVTADLEAKIERMKGELNLK